MITCSRCSLVNLNAIPCCGKSVMLIGSHTLYMKKMVGTVGTREHCPLTRPLLGFSVPTKVRMSWEQVGTTPIHGLFVPTVPTLFPLSRWLSGNSSIPWYIRLTGSLGSVVPTVPTIFAFSFTCARARQERKRATSGGPLLPSGWRHSSSCPSAPSANTRSVSRYAHTTPLMPGSLALRCNRFLSLPVSR